MVETIRLGTVCCSESSMTSLDFSKIGAGKAESGGTGDVAGGRLEIVVGLIDHLAMDRQVDLTFFRPSRCARSATD